MIRFLFSALGMSLVASLASCTPSQLQDPIVVLYQVSVSQTTKITCTRGEITWPVLEITAGQTDPFSDSGWCSYGKAGLTEVKAEQATSGKTATVKFTYEGPGTSASINVGYRIVVREENATLVVKCFTDSNLTKPCVLK
jgi:hypothetical protein